ncbi:hypothetical protein ACIRS3_36610 [Streptomyces virginiae]|uniref:hypothetical protein n=1 Tax=Streptomyces virginiae TaxID=1961 RepID=UPI00381CE99E
MVLAQRCHVHLLGLPRAHRQGVPAALRRHGAQRDIDDEDAKDEINLVGVTGKASPLTVIDQSIPATVTAKSVTSGNTRWWLSKPAASWKLTVRNTTSGITS